MVTNRDYNSETINTFINLFKYAQQFYGQRNSDEFSFSMFFSGLPYSDLIFQDAAQKLIVLPECKLSKSKCKRSILHIHLNTALLQLCTGLSPRTRNTSAGSSPRPSRRWSAPTWAGRATCTCLCWPSSVSGSRACCCEHVSCE